MRLLIIGGNRFIGASLVELAVKQNHDVTVLSLDKPIEAVKWIKADRNQIGNIFDKLSFDTIIDNIAFYPTQVDSLIEALKGKANRYVLTSSVDIYCNQKAKYCDEEIDERLHPILLSDNLEGWEPYVRGKRACELVLQHSPHFEKVIVRPAIVMGPRDPNKISTDGISTQSAFFPARIIDGNKILLHSDDTKLFNTVYVEDVANALLLAATHPAAANQKFNVVGEETWTSERMVYELSNSIGKDTEIARVSTAQLNAAGLFNYATPYSKSPVHSWVLFSNEKLKSLGWSPTPVSVWGKTLFTDAEQAAKKISGLRQKEISIRTKSTVGRQHLIKGRHNRNPLSFVGIGTSNGSVEDDLMYLSAIKYAVRKGINTIDTAINYRDTHSEIIVGRAIRELVAEGIDRDSLYVVSKGGFIPKRLLSCGILDNREIESHHCIRSEYINLSLQCSRENTQLETIDAYLLHNPEEALVIHGENDFYNMLIETFALLEQRVSDGTIGSYGIATWNSLRNDMCDKSHIDLNRVIGCSKIAAGGQSSFSVVQLPFNNELREAAVVRSQKGGNHYATALEVAKENDLTVLTSRSVNFGRNIEESLRFIHGYEEINCALIGMRQHAHIDAAVAFNGP